MAAPGKVHGLDADAPLRVAAERLLLARLADVRAAGARAARRLDPRIVHDLRVACRRLRAAVKVFGKKRLRKLDARIAHLQDALGALRDLQLEARWLARHRRDAGGVRTSQRKAEAHVRSALALWTRRSEPLLLRALPHLRGGGTLGGKRPRRRLRKRLRDVDEALSQRRPLDPATAHHVRIAVKKLRYEAELLRDAFDLDELLKVLSDLQDTLGELHDSDVRLREFATDRSLARVARAERSRKAARARRTLRRFRTTFGSSLRRL